MNRYTLAIVIALLTGCGAAEHARKTDVTGAAPVAVSVIETKLVEWPSVYEAPGTVRALTTSTLSSKVMGFVRDVRVQPGDRVKEGQVLVVIDSRDLETSVLQAKAAEQEARSGVAEAENAIAAAKAQMELAQVTFRRMDDLYAKKSISNQEFDEALARLKSAEATHQMAVSKRAQLDARIAQVAQGVQAASVMRTYGEIRSPFSGTVIEKRVEPGQMATPGTPLLTVEQTGRYRLEAPVQESMLGAIREGQTVSVVLDSFGQTVNARVTEIVPSVDAASRAFLVKATLPAASNLRTGLFGRLQVQRGTERTIAIPAEAVSHRGALQSVFVADGDTARLRMITTAGTRDGQVQVLSGLSEKERVIFPRPAGLADGTRIEVRR